MNTRALHHELDNINATVAMVAREFAADYDKLNEEQRLAFVRRIQSFEEKAKAIHCVLEILSKMAKK